MKYKEEIRSALEDKIISKDIDTNIVIVQQYHGVLFHQKKTYVEGRQRHFDNQRWIIFKKQIIHNLQY